MLAMMISGRIVSKAEPRLVMLFGLGLISWSLWDMTGWTPDVARFELITNSMVQGAGLGFVFTPLTVVAFATLPAELRTDGTALFSLVRNVGSAIGVSVTSFLLAQNTQIMHAALAEHVNPFNRMLQFGGAYQFWNIANPQSLVALNAEITRQSTIIAYVDDFKLMMLVTLPTALLLMMMSAPKAQPGAASHAEVLD
jgi:DHA2 family multidrug resistance protein